MLGRCFIPAPPPLVARGSLHLNVQWMPSMPPTAPSSSSTDLVSCYSCVGFLSIITIYRLWHQNNNLEVLLPHKNVIISYANSNVNNLGVSTIQSEALFHENLSPPSVVASFPWEPKRVSTQKEVDASVVPSAKCQTVDAQQQLHFLSSMTFANGLRQPSCPCCQ